MPNEERPATFSDYQEYLKYQVDECVTAPDHPYYKDVAASHQRIIDRFLDETPREARILDCGCGYGFSLQAFRMQGFSDVQGTDVSPARMKVAREAGYPVHSIDMHDMSGIPAESLDVVYSSHSLEHALDPLLVLRQIFRLLKPQGTLMLVLPYPVSLDDEHVAKAHCGAEALGVTISDGGATLIERVSVAGFSLRARGSGSYRNEPEIYLKLGKGSSELPVVDFGVSESGPLITNYGPKSSPAGASFNLQPNGRSALWFELDDSGSHELVVELGGHCLKCARSGNQLSAYVPARLLAAPAELPLSVFPQEDPGRASLLTFTVTGKGASRTLQAKPATGNAALKPNLFIVGAPRSGTTSLYWGLDAHPDVYMSRPEEPFFFDERAYGVLRGAVDSEKAYLDLYRYAPTDALFVGEASTTYLSSESALRRIHVFNPEARILILLRNPIAACMSMYSQMRKGGRYELEPTFESAWRSAPAASRAFVTDYRNLYRIGHQLQAAERIFSRSRVHVVLFDDLAADSATAYADVLRFLGLPAAPPWDVPVTNSSRLEGVRELVSAELLCELIDYFRPEVQLVSDIVGRDLGHWYES